MAKRISALAMLVALLMFVALPALAQDGGEEAVLDWAWLNALVAFFLPLAISFLKKQSWSPQVKKYFAFGVSAVVGVVTVGFDQGWDFETFMEGFKLILASVTQIWVIAQVAYLSFWQGSAPEVALAEAGPQ